MKLEVICNIVPRGCGYVIRVMETSANQVHNNRRKELGDRGGGGFCCSPLLLQGSLGHLLLHHTCLVMLAGEELPPPFS